jgi:hypothetical protein
MKPLLGAESRIVIKRNTPSFALLVNAAQRLPPPFASRDKA